MISNPTLISFLLVAMLASFAQTQEANKDKLIAGLDPDQELGPLEYENLFGHISNDPLVRNAKGIPIYCGIEIQDIRDLDAARGTYSIRGFLWYYWDDKRFVFDANGIDSLKWDYATLSSAIWVPEIEFDNGYDEVRRWGETIEISPRGEIEYWCYFSGTFSDQDGLMDFRKFPCDFLPVTIDLTSPYRKSLLHLLYCRQSIPSDVNSELSKRRHPEFYFSDAKIESKPRQYSSEWNREFDVLRFTVYAKRNKGYYLFHIILPVSSILVVFLFGQKITIEEFEARLGLAITCLLSLIAYTFSFSDSLPKVGYLTFMDYFITFNYLMIAAGTSATCSYRWMNQKNEKTIRFIKSFENSLPWCTVVFLCCVLLALWLL